MENNSDNHKMTDEIVDPTANNTESEQPDMTQTDTQNPTEKEGFFDKLKNAAFGKAEPKEEVLSEAEQLKIEKAELHDKYVRLFAEFDNFKKRSAKDRLEMITMASADVMRSLLPVLDDFERASKALESKEYVADLEGYQLIYNKLKNILDQKMVREMNFEKGADFDAEYQEAITEIPAGSELAGKVVDVIEKGYLIGDKVLRFAKVVVGANISE